MPAVYICDICGAEDAGEDYDGSILCVYHMAQKELDSAKRAYKERRAWVHNVWIKQLMDMRREIERLERVIAENEPPNERKKDKNDVG